MKRLMLVIALILLTGMSIADTSFYKDSKGDEFFTGSFYKEADTGDVYKVLYETNDTIYIAPFEDGELKTL